MKPSELVEKAMHGAGLATRYALAKQTGVREQKLSDYAKNTHWPNNNVVRILAEAAGLNPLEVIAELEIAKAEDAATKTAWGKALASIRNSSAALLLVVCACVAAVNVTAQNPVQVLRRLRRSIIFIM